MYEAIAGPICALYECTTKDIMLDPERRTLVAALCEEMFNVIGRELTLPPSDKSNDVITPDFIYRLVQFRSGKSGITNGMLSDCLAGRDSDILALNGCKEPLRARNLYLGVVQEQTSVSQEQCP